MSRSFYRFIYPIFVFLFDGDVRFEKAIEFDAIEHLIILNGLYGLDEMMLDCFGKMVALSTAIAYLPNDDEIHVFLVICVEQLLSFTG